MWILCKLKLKKRENLIIPYSKYLIKTAHVQASRF
jgi:hypothetical protein